MFCTYVYIYMHTLGLQVVFCLPQALLGELHPDETEEKALISTLGQRVAKERCLVGWMCRFWVG